MFSRIVPLLALTGLLATSAVHSSPLEARDTQTCRSAGVTQPAAGTSVSSGDTIPFSFDSSGFPGCHPGYTPISVWLLASQPTSSSLDANHQFSDYLYHFGDYLINNFAPTLPPMGTPPPSTLTVPELGTTYEGHDVYIAVVQTERDCPPDGHIEYCFSSSVLHYITD